MKPIDGLVTIILPAKDEASGIGETLDRLPVETLHAEGYDVEVVVLDGHSRDKTRSIAMHKGAKVITDPGRGKGIALRAARRRLRGNYIVMLDADGSYAADAIPRMLDPLARGEADIVMGDRHPLPGAMSQLHRFGNAMLSLEASVLYGTRCHDVCTGIWAFRASALRSMPLRSRGFEIEAELFSLANRMGIRIAHVPVDYLPRAGETKLSATRDGLRIGWCLLRSRFIHVARPGGGSPQVVELPAT